MIAAKMFNTFSRNTLKRYNDGTNTCTAANADRKIRKLQSKTAK